MTGPQEEIYRAEDDVGVEELLKSCRIEELKN